MQKTSWHLKQIVTEMKDIFRRLDNKGSKLNIAVLFAVLTWQCEWHFFYSRFATFLFCIERHLSLLTLPVPWKRNNRQWNRSSSLWHTLVVKSNIRFWLNIEHQLRWLSHVSTLCRIRTQQRLLPFAVVSVLHSRTSSNVTGVTSFIPCRFPYLNPSQSFSIFVGNSGRLEKWRRSKCRSVFIKMSFSVWQTCWSSSIFVEPLSLLSLRRQRSLIIASCFSSS